MSISARNQLSGKVTHIAKGAINNEVSLSLDNGDEIKAVITQSSCNALQLAIGKKAIAFIKAPWVILATNDGHLQFSARNQFQATISAITQGSVNSTVQMRTIKGTKLTAIITNESVKDMSLTVGSLVVALIKASSVMLATAK